jgi:hypothetical protein
MGWVVRLYEKLTGRPHRHDDAEMVSAAAKELSSSIRELSATLKPYNESGDPLVALMTDVLDHRRRGGSRDAKSKFYS